MIYVSYDECPLLPPLFLTITTTMSITRVLVFDTETNGLLPKRDKNTHLQVINEYPNIIQLSFALYNLKTGMIEQTYNNYIKVGDGNYFL